MIIPNPTRTQQDSFLQTSIMMVLPRKNNWLPVLTAVFLYLAVTLWYKQLSLPGALFAANPFVSSSMAYNDAPNGCCCTGCTATSGRYGIEVLPNGKVFIDGFPLSNIPNNHECRAICAELAREICNGGHSVPSADQCWPGF